MLEPLAQELGGRALAVDLADPAEVDRLVAEAGGVDVVVHNAALPASGDLREFIARAASTARSRSTSARRWC